MPPLSADPSACFSNLVVCLVSADLVLEVDLEEPDPVERLDPVVGLVDEFVVLR